MIFQYLVCPFFAKDSSRSLTRRHSRDIFSTAVLFAVIYTIIVITLVFKLRKWRKNKKRVIHELQTTKKTLCYRRNEINLF